MAIRVMSSRKLIRVISTLTIACSCVFCGLAILIFIIRADDVVEASGSVEADPSHAIRAANEGVIDRIMVRDGSEVNKGDVIASIRNGDLANRIEELRLNVSELERRRSLILSRLNYLEAVTHVSEIDGLLLSRNKESLILKGTEIEKNSAETEKERMGFLHEEGLVGERQYKVEELRHRMLEVKEAQQVEVISKIDQDIKLARARHTETLLQLNLELQQNRTDEKKARLQLAQLEEQTALSLISAPQKGTIILDQPPEKLIGQQVRPGDKVADLIEISSIAFKASVSETNIRKLKEGQSVNLEIKAFPHQKFKVFRGTVTNIAKQASVPGSAGNNTGANSAGKASGNMTSGNMIGAVNYEVKVQLSDNAVNLEDQNGQKVFYLKPGLSGTARIIINHDLRLVSWLRLQLFGEN
jgi:multidrug resistance efflux pump